MALRIHADTSRAPRTFLSSGPRALDQALMPLFDYWSRLPAGEAVHPDDRAALESGPHAFHFDLPPAPVLGPLRTAPVVLCCGNPGYEKYEAEFVREPTRKSWLAQQIDGMEPFPVWMPGWGDALAARCRLMGLGQAELADTVAIFNVVAYASERLGVDETAIARHLPSAAVARSYLHDVLIPRARREEIFLVVVRSHVLWGAVGLAESRTCRFSRDLALDGKLGVLGAEIRGWLDHRKLAAAS
jgi:hypothetical protein